jgi:hypothetical protein
LLHSYCYKQRLLYYTPYCQRTFYRL